MYAILKVSQRTKRLLDMIRGDASYDEVITDLVEDHLELNPQFLKSLDKAYKEYVRGRIIRLEEIERELEDEI